MVSDEACVHTIISTFSCDGLSSQGSRVDGTHLWLVHEEEDQKSSRRAEKLPTSPVVSEL